MELLVIFVVFFILGMVPLILLQLSQKWVLAFIKIYASLCIFFSLIALYKISYSLALTTKYHKMKVEQIEFKNKILSYQFEPNISGRYSIVLAFYNRQVESSYEACQFSWEQIEDQKQYYNTYCSKAIIYRNIVGNINHKDFHGQLIYQDWKNSTLSYGYNIYPVGGEFSRPALRVYTFNANRKTTIPIVIELDVTEAEIKNTHPVLIIGPDNEFCSNSSNIALFMSIYLPLFITAIPLMVRAMRSWSRNKKSSAADK